MIDIGGSTLIRASAKNYNSVTTICSSKYYKSLETNMKKNSGFTDLNYRKKMAEKTFRITSEYDKEIYRWFSKNKNQGDIKTKVWRKPKPKSNPKTTKK